jgi:hypothetical protein
MRRSSAQLKYLRRWFVTATTALLHSGCSGNYDFGEIRPDLVHDDIHDWLGPAALIGSPFLPSSYELTDDERQLRDLAYPLIEPPYDRQRWYSVLGEYGLTGLDRRTVFSRRAYASHLLSDDYRSPTARYQKVIEDARNDVSRMPQFFETAKRVRDMDEKRWKSFSYIPDLKKRERVEASRRIRENEFIVSWVRSSLAQRAEAYRFALERLVIMTPSPLAVDTELAIKEVEARLAQYAPKPPTASMKVAATL